MGEGEVRSRSGKISARVVRARICPRRVAGDNKHFLEEILPRQSEFLSSSPPRAHDSGIPFVLSSTVESRRHNRSSRRIARPRGPRTPFGTRVPVEEDWEREEGRHRHAAATSRPSSSKPCEKACPHNAFPDTTMIICGRERARAFPALRVCMCGVRVMCVCTCSAACSGLSPRAAASLRSLLAEVSNKAQDVVATYSQSNVIYVQSVCKHTEHRSYIGCGGLTASLLS